MTMRPASSRTLGRRTRRFAAALAPVLLLAACSSPNAPPQSSTNTARDTATKAARAATSANADVRALVERFGKKMQEVSTLAPPEAVRSELPGVYGNLLSPELLADWKAHPDRVVGRNYGSSPWPSDIEIANIDCAKPVACHITGKVDYITSNEVEHGGVFQRRGITLDAAHTAQGWRITAARLAPDTP